MRLSSSLRIFLWALLSSRVFGQHILTVAAAADLAAAEPALASGFETAHSSVKLKFVNGASASLAQQIGQGAPFDVFLSANIDLVDQLRLESRTTYAIGHVAVLFRDGKVHDLSELAAAGIRYVALPNPQLAPYGLAARQALEKAGLWIKVQPKVVYGENVRQTLQLFDSGNADAVLTALSLVVERHAQIVPSSVVQKGGVVPGSKEAVLGRSFLQWLGSAGGREVLRRFGFDGP